MLKTTAKDIYKAIKGKKTIIYFTPEKRSVGVGKFMIVYRVTIEDITSGRVRRFLIDEFELNPSPPHQNYYD